MRLRIRLDDWPRPALVLTDTPKPKCPDCHGSGITDLPDWRGCCPCWSPEKSWLLAWVPMRLAHRMAWRRWNAYSDTEAPF
jgi:hypothetical protein